eukprot:GHVS01000204.1.p1 GENE.GHVS01000204.1~~GHVS01000204.1.p1  ORF type:complete len:257 (+),score=44.63 GHVS01000204.1:182-952(+)
MSAAATEAEPQTRISIRKAKPETPTIARRPIGFRGNHQHGRPLYDPVYPTSKVPTTLIPRYRKDWRNSGRALLTVGMSYLEGRLLRHTKQCLQWQAGGPCAARCQGECAKSPWRCLCAWRVRGLHQHIVDMDGVLGEFKGRVDTAKPLFTVQRPEAEKNKFQSEAMHWDKDNGRFVFSRREPNLLSGFGLLHNRDETHYDERDKQYDSEEDPTADSSDDEWSSSSSTTAASCKRAVKKAVEIAKRKKKDDDLLGKQ